MEDENACRICLERPDEENLLLTHICECDGTAGGIHEGCLEKEIAFSHGNTKCTVCHTEYKLRFGVYDATDSEVKNRIGEWYRQHKHRIILYAFIIFFFVCSIISIVMIGPDTALGLHIFRCFLCLVSRYLLLTIFAKMKQRHISDETIEFVLFIMAFVKMLMLIFILFAMLQYPVVSIITLAISSYDLYSIGMEFLKKIHRKLRIIKENQ